MAPEELAKILELHQKWLYDTEGGDRANLRRANLQDADLRRANLRRANLQDADLRRANLRRANLQGANLQGANLQDADLRRADLRRADLQGANLQDANLQGANLQDADLRRADLDFACWPLWCGSLGVKTDRRIAAQLAYHFCRLDCDDPDYIAAKKAIAAFANAFHRVDECGKIDEV